MQSYLFHISRDGSLSEMLPRAYDNEDRIQGLLAEHPAILGGQYSGQEPRRWALIQREVPVPDGTVSDRRWSLDHLYVDQGLEGPWLEKCEDRQLCRVSGAFTPSTFNVSFPLASNFLSKTKPRIHLQCTGFSMIFN